mmetsp:Transcript_6751/g.9860  ORF Transcript_6751/g.9860 Transcript_6751/m.9860 type:complete len:517 (-) Transcript_6751:145-1695(-)
MMQNRPSPVTRRMNYAHLAAAAIITLLQYNIQAVSAFQSAPLRQKIFPSSTPSLGRITQALNKDVSTPFLSDQKLRQMETCSGCANSAIALRSSTENEVAKAPGMDILKWFSPKETVELKDDTMSVVERYFDAWNRRDMDEAIELFAEDCVYEDTQYADPFTGKDALRRHLFKVADALPPSFEFVVDDIAISSNGKIGVQWHVENDGEQLPFTRGCSFYTTDESGLIKTGFDVPEPAVIKPGGAGLNLLSLASKVIEEPIRGLPLLLWGAYMYIVFFSDGILPGANALQLEQRTWEEVRDLSLNFFLVSPLLHLPFAPVVHPMLEGIFNLLLSWAAMFAGFLSDEREKKQNQFPMIPAVVGMQFLTSAFYLPYLASRSTEKLEPGEVVYEDDLGVIEKTVGEYRGLGLLLGSVGTGSIVWGLFARQAEFGDFSERYTSLIDLLSIDRVGSSFIVDLVIFGLFQGWLVDDDMRRRGVNVDDGEMLLLRGVAKFVPFFGLATYLTLRPSLPTRESSNE